MEVAEVLSRFRRRLVLRLLMVGVLASLLAGAAAYFIKSNLSLQELVTVVRDTLKKDGA